METDSRYLELMLGPLRISEAYEPRMGTGTGGMSLEMFREIFGNDQFYSMLGLADENVWRFHRQGGGMTSLYRQLGIGFERLVQAIVMDHLGLTASDIVAAPLDVRVPLAAIRDDAIRRRVQKWLAAAGRRVRVRKEMLGAVFEVKQGYKSCDASRRRTDLRNAETARKSGFLPCMLVLSSQVDASVRSDYSKRWVIMDGAGDGETTSTYLFMSRVIGYDLKAFLDRNAATLSDSVRRVIRHLAQ